MQNSIRNDFMVGALTDRTTIDTKMENLSKQLGGMYEILYYRKNHNGIWLQEEIIPIRNEESIIVLFLVTFRDITPFKEPLEGPSVMTNLSKFARLAWTLTRSKQANQSAPPPPPPPTGTSASVAATGSSSNHLAATNTNHNTPQLMNHRSQNANQLGLKKPARSSLNSPSNPNMTYMGVNRFTEALPQYRHVPPKTPPHILLHYSTFKVTWDWVILGLTFYTVIMVPFNLAVYRTSFTTTGDITFLVVDSIVDIIFLIDIIFNFHTSFVGNDGAVIVDEVKIRSNYLRSGFPIDVMACLPYDALNIFDIVENSSSTTNFSDYTVTTITGDNVTNVTNLQAAASGDSYGNVFSILKVMRLFRLGRVARALHRFLESSFALLFLMLGFFLVVAHWFACIWYVIGMEDLKSGISFGWLSNLATTTKSPFLLAIDQASNTTVIAGGPPTISIYLTSLYFTMTCMTSIGFGNVAAETDSEKIFCVLMMVVSSLLYAAIFGHVTTIIHNATEATAKYHEMLNSVREFMTLNEVPRTLCERVLDYVVSKWANTKGVDQEKVLSVCPKDMRADICVHLNRRVFNGCSAFRLASDGCLRALAVNFDMIHSAPGDFIFRKGESIRELCFVVSGSLEVIQDGEIMAFLGKGDVFGDAGWRNHTVAKSAVHVRSLTYCDIHMINVEKLKEILEFYKAFAQTFARNLVLTYDLAKRAVFYRIADKHLEKMLSEQADPRTMFSPSQIALLRRAVEKFKAQLANETGSVCSTSSPKSNSGYHRITPMSPSYSMDNSNRVTTSAIVSHENSMTTTGPLDRKVSRNQSGRNGHSRSSHTTSREVKWKDKDQREGGSGGGPNHGDHHEVWKEVNYNLNRLDRKIVHLETLIARFTDSIHQAATVNTTTNNFLPNTAGSNPSGSGNNDQQGQIVTHHQIQNQNQNNNPVNLIPHQNPVHDDQSSAI